jgi:hypothetical protein
MIIQQRARLSKAKRMLLAMTCLAVLSLTAQASAFQGDKDLFADLNMAGRTAYAQARSKALDGDVPVFVVSDKVTLIKGKQLGSRSYTPALYDQLKSLSHLPLGIASAGIFAMEMPGDPAWRAMLEDLSSKANAAQSRLNLTAFNPTQKERQMELIERSLAYINRALAKPTIDPQELRAYSNSVAPLLLSNATEAAQVQIQALDQAVNDLAKQLTPDEWARAAAIITGPKTAREGNLQAQYFLFAWNEKATGQRVHYMENVFADDQALGVFQTVLNDRKIGTLFFNEPSRMERDLLGDAATVELMRRFGRLGPFQP